jgi:hypothetical protein
MWNRLYRDHLIMPFPSYDTVTNGWAPQADISWCAGASRESEFVTFPKRFATEADAVGFALRSSEAWIDNRLGRLQNSESKSEPAAAIHRIGALKKSLRNVGPAQAPRTQSAVQHHAETKFTFGHFKSVIDKSGVKISEPTLQKSYAALVKLRENNHWSWSQTKDKVERSQCDHSMAESPSRQQRATRIPLTQRDWRRIV